MLYVLCKLHLTVTAYTVNHNFLVVLRFLMVIIKLWSYQHGQLSLHLEENPYELNSQVHLTYPLVPR